MERNVEFYVMEMTSPTVWKTCNSYVIVIGGVRFTQLSRDVQDHTPGRDI